MMNTLLATITVLNAFVTPKLNAQDYTIIATPVITRMKNAAAEISTSYLNWGCIKSNGKQIQFGQLLPAVAIINNQITTVHNETYLYQQADFWMTVGPELIHNGKPTTKREWKQYFKTLDTNRKTHRVAICVNDQQFWFVYTRGTLQQLQQLCAKTGAKHAFNLDGGSCTVFVCNGKRIVGKQAKLKLMAIPRRK